MKIVSVAGTSNTGKTTLVTQIIKTLVKRGYNVGSVKHAHRSMDIEGKDTNQHLKSGAELVVGAGSETFFLLDESMELEKIIKIVEFVKELDFLVLEGFKSSPYVKIATAKLDDPYVITQVNTQELDERKLEDIIDLIEQRSYGMLANMNCKECGYKNCLEMAQASVRGEVKEDICVMKKLSEVELTVNDERVPLNPFVQRFVKNTFMGMMTALKTDALKGSKEKIVLKIDESHR